MNDPLEEVRKVLMRCVKAIDSLHAHDEVVRELRQAGLSEELSACVNAAVGILDATAC